MSAIILAQWLPLIILLSNIETDHLAGKLTSSLPQNHNYTVKILTAALLNLNINIVS